ncbi:MAG: hypothetical protein HFE30_05835 [Clostridiales bacterium]|nr:hypothetical protein [Clostridiales bacterium]
MADKIKREFENPSSEYRTAPFWSWNEEMDGEELSAQLRDFKAHGIGGGFAHPRIGMITEYLSEDYFKAWGKALETAKKEDMKLYMYDENAWPSGMAGGLVADHEPGTIGMLAKYRIVDSKDPEFTGEVLFAREYDEKDGKELLGADLSSYPKEEWKNHTDGRVMVVYIVGPTSSDWNGGHPYPDVTNRLTTDTFLDITYEEYFRRFGEEFGKTIPAVFSDEANMHSEGLNTVPYMPHVIAKFRELCGYDLTPNLAAVFRDVDGIKFDRPVEKIRYDYFYTLHELWIDNFIRPISEWCEKHGIAWTGHDVEHQWPQAHNGRISPSEQTTYEFRQWPGLDLLLCHHLINEPTNFDKFVMYEIRSAANQFSKERTICEAYGAGGYQTTLDDYKRLGDYLLVGGINLIIQHLSLYSFIGARKRDCPQSFDYRQPWWDEYHEFADYFARGSYILSQGKMEQRILLLNASTTGYLTAPEKAWGTVDHSTDVNCIKNPDMSDFLTLVNELTDKQWDFDIGDEYSLSRNTKIEDGKFKFGNQAYDVVIVSANMRNMRRDTAALIQEFAKSGGCVVTTDNALESVCEYIDGELGTDETEKVRAVMQTVCGAEKLDEYLAERLPRRITSKVPFETGVQHMRRVLPDGRVVYFIVNHSMGVFETELTIDGNCVSKWDMFTGESHGVECRSENGKITFPLKLERCGSALFIVGDDSEISAEKPQPSVEVEVETVSIERERENTFTLDHVILECDGETDEPRYFIEACENLFKKRGFYNNPWGSAIQKRFTRMEKNSTYGDDSGFSAYYKFTVGESALPCRITAGIERAELYHVSINGHELSPVGKDILDRGMSMFDISDYVTEGENTIALKADKFNVLCELEAIILRGNFTVESTADHFEMRDDRALGYGAWNDYGMTFYPYAVNYKYKVTLDRDASAAEISLGEHSATAVSVSVNGGYIGVVGRDGGAKLDLGDSLKRGENEVVLRVCGSYRNLLGPYLGYDPLMAYDWAYFERGRTAVPSDYDFEHYGLTSAPVIKITK